MKKIIILNSKGGVGKSTITCNIAVIAAQERKKVLIIDVDPQGTSISFRSIRETIDISGICITKPTIHKDICNFNDFDLVIVDVGGTNNELLRSAIMAANGGILLIPTLPSQADFWAIQDVLEILQNARMMYDIPAYVIMNRIVHGTKITGDARTSLVDLFTEYDVKLLDTILYNRVDYMYALGKGKGVTEFKPQSLASIEISQLYNEIVNLNKEDKS